MRLFGVTYRPEAPYQSLDEAIREMSNRPSMHPHSRHPTIAGPIHHVMLKSVDGVVRGRLYMGMRKYGYIEIVFHYLIPSEWAKNRYARDIQNAISDAWRC